VIMRICSCAAFTSSVRTMRFTCLFIATAPSNSFRETFVGVAYWLSK
jgi:hypothetical protein